MKTIQEFIQAMEEIEAVRKDATQTVTKLCELLADMRARKLDYDDACKKISPEQFGEVCVAVQGILTMEDMMHFASSLMALKHTLEEVSG